MSNIELKIAKIIRKIKLPVKINQIYNDNRHKKIEEKLKSNFIDSDCNYIYDNDTSNSEKIIWIFWWQGEEKMPPIVKACFESVKKNKGNSKLVLITKDNIKNYATIPDFVYKKVEKGEITLTHLSDILRFNLLNNFGGLWLDATVYVTSEITDEYFSKLFTCSGYDDKEHFFVAQGRWTGFIIGGSKHNPLFQYMNSFFINYWKNHTKLIDYFLIDYALNYAWENNIGNFRLCSESNSNKFNINLFKLEPLLNHKFNSKKLKKLKVNTIMFKLNYKHEVKLNGTFAGYIIDSK